MTVKLRLMRMGKKKQPTYRIVVADSRSPRDGRFIETVGTYAPRIEPSTIEIDNAKAVSWLAKGAQPTERVRKLLVVSGAWSEFEAGRAPKAPAKPRASKAKAGLTPAKASSKTRPAKAASKARPATAAAAAATGED